MKSTWTLDQLTKETGDMCRRFLRRGEEELILIVKGEGIMSSTCRNAVIYSAVAVWPIVFLVRDERTSSAPPLSR